MTEHFKHTESEKWVNYLIRYFQSGELQTFSLTYRERVGLAIYRAGFELLWNPGKKLKLSKLGDCLREGLGLFVRDNSHAMVMAGFIPGGLKSKSPRKCIAVAEASWQEWRKSLTGKPKEGHGEILQAVFQLYVLPKLGVEERAAVWKAGKIIGVPLVNVPSEPSRKRPVKLNEIAFETFWSEVYTEAMDAQQRIQDRLFDCLQDGTVGVDHKALADLVRYKKHRETREAIPGVSLDTEKFDPEQLVDVAAILDLDELEKRARQRGPAFLAALIRRQKGWTYKEAGKIYQVTPKQVRSADRWVAAELSRLTG